MKDATIEEQEERSAAQYGARGTNPPTSDGLPPLPGRKLSSSTSERVSSPDGPNDGQIPLRKLLTPRVLLAIANYGMLAVLDIALGALQPLYFSTPVALGGLGFSPARIGIVIALFGIINGIFQGAFFSRIVGTVGLGRTFVVSMGAFAPLYALFPVISAVAKARGVGAEVWTLVVLQLFVWVVMDMSYGEPLRFLRICWG
jgi:hypothetical protein